MKTKPFKAIIVLLIMLSSCGCPYHIYCFVETEYKVMKAISQPKPYGECCIMFEDYTFIRGISTVVLCGDSNNCFFLRKIDYLESGEITKIK